MQKVLTAAQMREVDRLTTERYGIPSIILMENAAHAVARVITEKLGGSVKGKSILILCGKGNNGGDGAALARILWKEGCQVFVLLVGDLAETKGDAQINFRAFEKIDSGVLTSGGEFNKSGLEAQTQFVGERLQGFLAESRTDLYVDALFGTGLTTPLDGYFEDAIKRLNVFRPLTISIDLPSGLNADCGEPIGICTNANTTVTFTAPKPANVLPPSSVMNGELVVADIGSPQELIDEQPSQFYVAERSDPARWLHDTKFSNSSYKNKRGHALLIAGSKDYTGAAVLAADAAIRSGCGLVTLAVPEGSRESVVARVQPEVMVRGIAETKEGSAAESAADEVNEFFANVDAVAIGSGLSSKEDETKAFVRRVVTERKTPVIIDADGLTALSPWGTNGLSRAGDDGCAGGTPAFPALVLTPHEGEFRRLLGVEKEQFDEILKDRVAAVRDLATQHNIFLVLKGERNLIGSPDGRVVVNPTGNSGLGKAGNGDTLTGILVSFIAQAVQMKIDILETLVAAVYIAGMAGDVAEKKWGKRVMTASDVRECLSEVFASLEK